VESFTKGQYLRGSCLIKITYYDKFKKRFEEEAVLRNLSVRTRTSYWWHIEDFNTYCTSIDKNSEQSDIKELRGYFHKMLSEGRHRPGSVKMGYFALKFLFCNILHKDWAKEYLPIPKVAKTLPLVLSQEEVMRILSCIANYKHRTILMFIYSTGARVSEAVNIRIKDIDSKRMQVNIQEGKGLKQRKVQLSPKLLSRLRIYFKKYQPSVYLFEGAHSGSHISVSAVREICKKARYQTSEIQKEYTPHTFRHSFATHLLEQGTNLLVIQRLLGHSDLSNTLKYLHVQRLDSGFTNPLDNLDLHD
jgi:integrase/recombinase XerD